MTRRQPTSLPWAVWRLAPDSDPRQRHIITTADGEREITGIVHHKGDADYIVRCVNWHARLVQALQHILHDPVNANSEPDLTGALNAVAGIIAGVLATFHARPSSAPLGRSPNLPPDPGGMNDLRAAWAGESLRTFIDETGGDEEDALADLLGDLMHWCDRNNHDFDAALDRARFHYDVETATEPPT